MNPLQEKERKKYKIQIDTKENAISIFAIDTRRELREKAQNRNEEKQEDMRALNAFDRERKRRPEDDFSEDEEE